MIRICVGGVGTIIGRDWFDYVLGMVCVSDMVGVLVGRFYGLM